MSRKPSHAMALMPVAGVTHCTENVLMVGLSMRNTIHVAPLIWKLSSSP